MKTTVQLLQEIMETHSPALLRHAEHLVRDPHSARDVVQQVMIRLARLPSSRWPAPESMRAWLYRCTRNQAVDVIRQEQRLARLHQRQAEEPRPTRSVDWEDRHRQVLACVDHLSEKERTVLLLRLEEGLSYREIAEVTGWKEGHIGYLLHQAVQKLSAHLQSGGEA